MLYNVAVLGICLLLVHSTSPNIGNLFISLDDTMVGYLFIVNSGPAEGHTNYLCANHIVRFVDVIMVIMQEKKLVAEIKKTAKTGNEVSLKLWEIFGPLFSSSYVLTIDDLDFSRRQPKY